MIKRGSKKGYEFSFAWIFTMFVGAAFIGLAIYSASHLIQSRQLETESGQAKQIGVLLTPLDTGLEDEKYAIISVREKTRIFSTCRTPTTTDPFGSQGLSVALLSEIGDRDASPGVESTFHNKYIFSSNAMTGDDEFYALAMPFYFPFKIGDVTMLWSDDETYCFDSNSAPSTVKEELTDLNMSNIFLVPLRSCPESSKKVCFGTTSCEIHVDTNSQTVTKDGATLTYLESFGQDKYPMMYAAIFSNSTIYGCQAQRLMARGAELSKTYQGKALSRSASANLCATTIIPPLTSYYESLYSFSMNGEGTLSNLDNLAEEVDSKNPSSCRLW